MYLSLPLPSTMRTMTITVFSTDGTTGPSPYTISVPKSGDTNTLISALSNACLLRDDERLLVAEVYNNSIIWYWEEPSEVISLIRDGDRLVTYRLLKDSEDAPIVVFRNQHMEELLARPYIHSMLAIAAVCGSVYEFMRTLLLFNSVISFKWERTLLS